MVALAYFRLRNRSLEVFRRMERKSATFTFTEAGINVRSDNGSTELAWKLIDALYEYPNVWLLSIVHSTYITLPAAHLDEGTKNFVRSHVKTSSKAR